jgi:hypothetical protein
MRLRNMFVNILRQIDTRVPCNSLAAVSPALNRLTITLRPRCGQGLQFHTQFTSFRSSLTSADPPALMSSLLRSAASPALYVGRSATARSISFLVKGSSYFAFRGTL